MLSCLPLMERAKAECSVGKAAGWGGKECGRCKARGLGPHLFNECSWVIWRPTKFPARWPPSSPLPYTHLELSGLSSVFLVGQPRPVPLKRRLALGRSSWYPKETLVSCIRVLASNSTPTCSWKGPGQQTQLPRLDSWAYKPLATHAWKCAPTAGIWTSLPGYWLCGSMLRACLPDPRLLSPTSCSL